MSNTHPPVLWIINRLDNWFNNPSVEWSIDLLEDTGNLWDNLRLDEEKDAEDIAETLEWLRQIRDEEKQEKENKK